MRALVQNRSFRGEWLKMLWIVPAVFMFTIFLGLGAGAIEVITQNYLTHGLTNLAMQSFTRTMNFSLLLAMRLIVVFLLTVGGYLAFYKRFDRAVVAALGAGIGWMGLLLGFYLLMQSTVEGVEPHRLPDAIRRTSSVSGFMRTSFIERTYFATQIGYLVQRPLTVLSGLVLLLPFGFAFEAVLGKLRRNKERARGSMAALLFWTGFTLSVVLFFVINVLNILITSRANIPQPNVLIVSIDTLRADAVGAYGSPTAKTPILDKLAADGAMFTRAYSNSPWTLPSHATLFTGLTPSQLGIQKVQDRLGRSALTLAEVMRNSGYDTAAFTSYVLLSPAYGFDQGFDIFHYRKDATAEQIVDAAGTYFEQHQLKKFFMFLHIYDPHWPYRPKLEYAREHYKGEVTKDMESLFWEEDYYKWVAAHLTGPEEWTTFSRAMYDAEVSYVDAQLERLFRKLADLNMIDRTVIIVTSDHGEAFREHGLMGHGLDLYNESLHVPWIVRFPRQIPRGSVIEVPVQLADLMPTVLNMVGLVHPVRDIPGMDLTEVILAHSDEERNLMAETAMSGAPRFALYRGIHKFITPWSLDFGEIKLDHGKELYDLAADYGETENLIKQQPTLATDLEKRINTYLKESSEMNSRLGIGQSEALTGEEMERLRSLGYVR